MSTNHAREFYHNETKNALAKANARVAKFAQDLVENPAYAFEWADSTLEEAARVRLFSIIDNYLDDGATLDQVLELAQLEMSSNARLPNSSSSTGQCKNLLRNYSCAVAANEVEMIRAHLGLPKDSLFDFIKEHRAPQRAEKLV